MRFRLPGQSGPGNMRQTHQVVSDGAARKIREAAFKGPVLLYRPLASEPPIDVIVRSKHGCDSAEDVRLLLLDPAEFCGNQLLIQAIASSCHKRRGVILSL